MSGTFALGQPYGWGRSSQFTVLETAPAAGANFSVVLDSRWVWRFVSAEFTFTADANVANRIVLVEYQDANANVVEATGLGAVVAANGVATVHGSTAYTTALAVTNGHHFCPLPRAMMSGGGKVALVAANIQATDAFTLIRLTFDRFPTDPDYVPADSPE